MRGNAIGLEGLEVIDGSKGSSFLILGLTGEMEGGVFPAALGRAGKRLGSAAQHSSCMGRWQRGYLRWAAGRSEAAFELGQCLATQGG